MQANTLEKLQYISQGHSLAQQKNNILKALDDGARWIQIRWKQADEKEFHRLSQQVKQACDQYGAQCIINDHVHLAKDLDVDGVHLGLEDCSIAKARALLGPSKIIGGTANTFEDVQQRIRERCDYIGLGPFKHTYTKQKLSPLLGIEGYKNIRNKINLQGLPPTPIFAIGGIDSLDDIQRLVQAGVYGVALSGLVTQTPHIISSIKNILQ
ncbi:thiamine phosphate synthase [Sphingobacterium sp. N143]|uniref:thiamine phosphate synthase n=1 Tax=Sphingobacterium sp. N143 TaxID=2746727 RepID=UPI002576EB50|nr:thiamine phosphate synthase [Sphingobacterium sp. N143]MDM1293081.1 thiamine phosphate synthase [Sphingobacterium sp. N143]